ncbi:MAG TPA: AI-2E family transporter [Pseudomonadales bacterium]|nr:AI-2E family transporter [Pseudomonadales bacterium]
MRSNATPPGATQLRIIWFALTTLAVTAVVAIGVGLVWGIGKFLNLLSPVLWPLAIAAVLSYLLDPAVNWLERHRISRTGGIIIVFVVALSVLGGVLASVIPQIADETNNLAKKIPTYTAQAQEQLKDWASRAEKAAALPPPKKPETNSPSTNSPLTFNLTPPSTNSPGDLKTNTPAAEVTRNLHQINNQIMASATDWTAKILAKIGAWVLAQLAKATALLDIVVALILIPIYTFYFLREKRWIKNHWTQYLPIRNSRVKDEIIFIVASINQYMIAFFRGQVLVSICSGILYTIGFLILGLDYAFLLGFLCMLLTMVPFLGSIIGFTIAMVLTVMQFGDWFHPLMVFVVFCVVISLENFFYSPHIMGNRVGLHPLIIIVAVMIGITLLGGLLGGVLAIPLAAALRVIMSRYLWKPNREAG